MFTKRERFIIGMCACTGDYKQPTEYEYYFQRFVLLHGFLWDCNGTILRSFYNNEYLCTQVQISSHLFFTVLCSRHSFCSCFHLGFIDIWKTKYKVFALIIYYCSITRGQLMAPKIASHPGLLRVSFGESWRSNLISQRQRTTRYRYSHPFSTIPVIADRYLSVSAGHAPRI